MELSKKINDVSTNVNVLRFFAASLVIFCHSFYVAASKEDPFSVFCNGQTNFGGIAVSIFFFLSGLYVTKSLYKKNDVKEYMIKRGTRIFPQLWVVILASIVLLGPFFTEYNLSKYFSTKETYIYILNAVFIPIHNLPGVFQNNVYDTTVNGPLWTMPVEFGAYCVLAVVLIICKNIFKNVKLQKHLHVVCFLTFFLAFVLLDVVLKNEFLVTVVRPLVIFFAGVLYCDYADKIKLKVSVACVMLGIVLLGCKFGFLNYALIICLPYIVVALSLGLKQVEIKWKVFSISYEMYLVGWPLQQIVTHIFGGTMHPMINWLIVLPIDIALAYCLYVAIEKLEKKQG